MKNVKMRLLAVALSVAAVAAVGALAGLDQAEALPCCSSCEPVYLACVDGCGGNPTCEANCETRLFRCESHCSFGC
jgi:hypothetical protein